MTFPPPARPGGRLYRNDLESRGAVPRFTDVTDSIGLRADGYSMGVAVGDYDRDGDPDLVITNNADPVTLKVHWPDGALESWQGLATGRYHRLVRGSGAGLLKGQAAVQAGP